MIKNKFVKWIGETFSPYEDIKLNASDLKEISSLTWTDVFKKLFLITEYQLAMQLSKWRITSEEFNWAIKYWKYLIEYFNK